MTASRIAAGLAPLCKVAKQRIAPVSYTRLLRGGSAGDEARFQEAMAQRFGAETDVIALGRARSGIYLLTKFAVRAGRRKVLLSPYTIPDVVTMVQLAGGEPVFFDFEAGSTACDLAQLEQLLDDRTGCLFVTHYHVNEPRLAELTRLCGSRGVLLFDDCAISFGGSIDGKPLGTLADASVFSLSSFKLLNYFWGGLITTSNEEIAQFITREMSSWPRLSLRDYLRPAKGCLEYDVASRPFLFSALVFPLIRRRARRSGDAQSLENLRMETASLNATLTSRPALAALAEWSGKAGKIDGWLAHRRMIARVYLRRIGDRMVSREVAKDVIDGSCFVNFPVLVPEDRRDAICREMMLAGFDVGRSLYPNAHRHPKFSDLPGRSDNVDSLVRGTIYLPTHLGVSEQYAERLATRFAQSCRPSFISDDT